LLEGEFAGYRQRADIAFLQYTQQARATRDPGVVARAATISQLLGQAESLEMSRLWTEVDPDSDRGLVPAGAEQPSPTAHREAETAKAHRG